MNELLCLANMAYIVIRLSNFFIIYLNCHFVGRRRKEVMEVTGESWRAYYSSGAEHPLSAATSAVLGSVDDSQHQPIEYYKLPALTQDTHLTLHKDAKLVDVWP